MDNALYRDGERVAAEGDGPGSRVARLAARPGDFQWIGLADPAPEELAALEHEFGLHPLAVEDAAKSHQRPKLEHYGDVFVLVLKTLWYVDAEDAVETGEIHVLVGPDFVVTVRHGVGVPLADSRQDLERRAQVLAHGPMAVVYAVCDHVVDEYERVGGELEIDVDEVEMSVFSPTRTESSERIYVLKRELAEVRRAVFPLREPMRRFATGAHYAVDREASAYFRDVADHLQRVADVIDNLDALLSTAFDAYLARIQVQQNEDMRKISAGAALVVVPTLIAGVYGMNFEHMPELGWTYGYVYAVVLMLGTAGLLFVLFKRSNWL